MRFYKNKNFGHYLNLIRFYKPNGFFLLSLPCAWVLGMLAKSTVQFFLWSAIFALGAFLMRSAGCVINDLIDIEIDNKVLRTSSRPLTSGKLNFKQALFLLFFLLLGSAGILLVIGEEAMLLGFTMLSFTILYPFGKRFIKYPQLMLGLLFNSGALFASIAIVGYIDMTAALIYLGGFFWILYYDTIYGHQDKIYDESLGLHSMALTKFGNEIWLSRYYKFAVSFWAFAGVFAGLNLLYFIFIFGLFYLFSRQMQKVDLEDPSSCMDAFQFNSIIGFLLLVAILIGRV